MDEIAPLIATGFLLALPILAMIGGITKGVLKANARQRMIEIHHRERLAALERGVDPTRLPPLEMPADEGELTFEQRQTRRSQVLLIVGLALALGGVAFAGFLASVAPRESVWPIGIVIAAVGTALLIGSFVVRPR